MRLQQKQYSNNLLLQPAALSGGTAASAGNAADSKPVLVHSNIYTEDATDSDVDFVTRAAQASKGRSAWVGSKLKSHYQALVRKFERAGSAELENYLAASQNLAQLEERIRRYERTQYAVRSTTEHGANAPHRHVTYNRPRGF